MAQVEGIVEGQVDVLDSGGIEVAMQAIPHQVAQYPGLPSGNDLMNPDFAGLGSAYGALGLKVNRDDEFLPALKQAMSANRSALIEVSTDLEYVTPTATLTELSGKPLQGGD